MGPLLSAHLRRCRIPGTVLLMQDVANGRFVPHVRHGVNIFRTGRSNSLGNIAFRIINIPEEASLGTTGFHAGRHVAYFLKMTAERALFHHFRDRIEGTGAVRASCDAHLAADALFFIYQDLSILGLIRRSGRANLDAGSVFTVLTNSRQEVLINIRILADRADRQNFVVINPHRDIVFYLACDLAGMTSDAAVEVNY